MKEVNTRNLWTFELGTQEGINVSLWNFVGFRLRVRQHSQNFNNDTSYRPPVTSTQSILGTKIYPDVGIFSNYDIDGYSQG